MLTEWEKVLLKWDRTMDGQPVRKDVAARVVKAIKKRVTVDGEVLWDMLTTDENDTIQALSSGNHPDVPPIIMRRRIEQQKQISLAKMRKAGAPEMKTNPRTIREVDVVMTDLDDAEDLI